jgi:polyhydroxyalkanoate synthesis regulator phasin
VKKVKEKIGQGIETPFQMLPDGLVVMGKQIYLPRNKAFKEDMLKEAYESHFTSHSGSTKMYRDLKGYYWWPNMKRKIEEFMSNYEICQQVKVEH